MNDKGNERALFFTTVTELTGETEHERLTELEVIFGQYEDIDAHALRRCANLHKLTFINCRLQRIPTLALHAVRESLVHLCLCAQNISIIEPLDLPNLRALYLQQNHIKRIEGLNACRRLQVLWLYGNRIGRIEGLGQSTDLRELWLQDNAIQSLLSNENDSALDALVNLESLCLAKNRIRNIDDLQTLRKLINLRSLSLVDEHFGSNPIVRHPEYRAVAIASLHQLQTLDGTGIEETERTMAVDQFLHQALAFNDTVADLTLSYEHELRAIQTRKERGQSNAEMMQRELVEALNGVEQLVVRGTVELDEERQRQTRLREEHTSITVEALAKLQHQYHQNLDRMLEDELRALDDEDLYYQVLEQEAAAEHNLALTIATVVCTSPERIAAEHLSEHASDFQHIAAHLDPAGEGGVGQTYRLLQVHRFHHTDLVRRFESYSSCDQASLVMKKNQHQGEGLMMHLYCIASENDLSGVMQHGFVGHSEGSASEWLVLFSSPLQALQFSSGALGSLKKTIEGADVDDFEPTARIRSQVLLLCQVLMTHVCPVTIDDPTMSHVGSLQYIVSLATAAASNPAQERRQEFYHATMGHDKYEGDIYITNRARDLPNVLPQFVVLCSQRLVETKVLSELGDHSNQPEALLESFSRHVNEEIASHHDRLWREMDPERWVRKTQLSSESEHLDRDISFEKERVFEEKRSQKRLLRSARPPKW